VAIGLSLSGVPLEGRAMSSALRRFLTRFRESMLAIAADGARDGKSLIVCQAGRSALANPVDWTAIDDSRWWIRLRGGECSWSREVIVTQEAADRLERALEPGLREIAAAAARLDRARSHRRRRLRSPEAMSACEQARRAARGRTDPTARAC
jgi:hypothetical protein